MSKKGVYKIEGNTSPKIGEKTVFKVVEWYPATPLSDRVQSKVTWELFIKENGKFRPANLKKSIGEFTFGTNADKFTYRVEGYLHSPEGKEPMSIIVQPQKNENPKPTAKKEILGVSLTYQDGSKITKTLNYQDKLRATAKCQALEGEHIVFCLWEDDEKNSGHNKKNQFIEKSPIIQVDSKGYARWNFTLLKTFISLAQKREDEDKKHEYYVTAEYNGKILNNSGNVNVNNPEPRIKITPKSSSSGAKPKTPPTVNKPKPQPDSPKGSTHQGSKNNQPDKKGVITNIKLTDLKGNAFKKRPKFGERIQLVIDGKDIKGKSYRLKIWEDDTTGKNDLLYNREHKFNGDKQIVYIDLTDDMQRVGEIGNNPKEPDSGEYWTGNYQEIYAEVILQNISSKSQIIDVDLKKVETKKLEKTKTAINVGETETKTTTVCECEQFGLIWGSKVSCKFRKKVVAIAKDLWPNNHKNMANNLMAIFAWETGNTFKPDVPNRKGSGATGLIQFLPERATEYFGKYTLETVPNYFNSKDKSLHNLPRVKEFAQMKAEDQLDYVKKYFDNLKNKKLEFVDLYLKVLFPVSSEKPEHFVFGLEKYRNEIGLPTDTDKVRQLRIDKYANNSGMDTFKDGKISKSEIALSIMPYITNGIPEIFRKGKSKKEDAEEIINQSDSIVVTDAGHGIGGDSGALGNGVTESEMALLMESNTFKALNSKGITVVRTRSKALTSSEVNNVNQVTYRVNTFKSSKATVMVSHHFNSVGSTNDILLMYHPRILKDAQGKTSTGASEKYFNNSQKLLESLKIELSKVFNDGRKIRPYPATYPNYRARSVGVLRDSDSSENAVILIEHGEMTDSNVQFCKNNAETIGTAIAQGIINYLGVTKTEENKISQECESESLITDVKTNVEENNEKKSQWHHPVNNPQLRGWYNSWAPDRSIHSSNIPGRTKGKHDGIDLYAPVNTLIYACIDGEINEIYTSESYGKCVNIKGTYNGKTLWFFYAHLSSISITAKDSSGNPTKVKAGDPIGKAGKTGSSAADLKPNQVHLHFEVRTTKERTGGRVDPFSYINELSNEVNKKPKKEDQP